MRHTDSVVLCGAHNVNSLGVTRGLGRKGIPIILLDIDSRSMVRFSRFVSNRVSCIDPNSSEIGFVENLIALGKSFDHRPVYIPTSDVEVLVLSKYNNILSSYFRMPVASFDTIDLLVNKKKFFQDVQRRNIPCPKTCFPETVEETRKMAAEIGYPLVVKSAYSHRFILEFQKKVFVVHSPSELETAIELLEGAFQDFFLQEIIPGNELYLFYTYLNRHSVPLGICGYDKVRQHPKDFGIGTICMSKNRPEPLQTAISYLQDIAYCGFAEPEFKIDPRDGLYKLIEINTRTVMQTMLASKGGISMEYLAYQDMIGCGVEPQQMVPDGILWIDEISELYYFLSAIRKGGYSLSEILGIQRDKIVLAGMAVDDPIPFVVELVRFFCDRLDLLWKKGRRKNSDF